MTELNEPENQNARSTNVSEAYFASGSAAEVEQGVLYQGDYQHEADGTGIAVRLHARALSSAGVPVLLKPFTAAVLNDRGVYEPIHVKGVSERVQAEVGDLPNASIGRLFPQIRHFVVHKPEDISKRLMRGAMGALDNPELLMQARKAVYGSSVLYSVWERDRIPDAMARELRRMGDNWVPCQQNVEMLRASGVTNVCAMPHPYDPSSPLLHLTRRKPMTTKRFYFIGRWEPRKNPVLLLETFAKAFRPGDDVHLTMKFHGQWEGYPSFDQTVEHILEDGVWTREQLLSQVTPVRDQLRPDQIVKLHFENNIYVAPSSGEAWCLPAFEAKLSGNRVVHVPYGGTADFCEEQDCEVSYHMGPVPETYGWAPGSRWAIPDEEHLCSILMNILPPGEYVRTQQFEEKFSLETVGKRMEERLRAVWGEAIRW